MRGTVNRVGMLAVAVAVSLAIIACSSNGEETPTGPEVTPTSPPVVAWPVWTAQDAGVVADLVEVFFIDAATGWAVGMGTVEGAMRGIVLATIDGGRTWSEQLSRDVYGFTSVYFVDATTGWVGGLSDGEANLFKTTDGGITWLPQHADAAMVRGFNSLHFLDAHTGWGALDSGTVFRTDNGGDTWMQQESGIEGPASHIFDIQFIDASTGWAIGWDFRGVVLATADGGGTWDAWETPTEFLNRLHAIDSRLGWLATLEGLFWSDDGGMTWSKQDIGDSTGIQDVYFVDTMNGWAVSPRGEVFASIDGGMTWHEEEIVDVDEETLATSGLHGIHMVNLEHGWAVGGGGLILHYGIPNE